jgi:hypothetical protein
MASEDAVTRLGKFAARKSVVSIGRNPSWVVMDCARGEAGEFERRLVDPLDETIRGAGPQRAAFASALLKLLGVQMALSPCMADPDAVAQCTDTAAEHLCYIIASARSDLGLAARSLN